MVNMLLDRAEVQGPAKFQCAVSDFVFSSEAVNAESMEAGRRFKVSAETFARPAFVEVVSNSGKQN